MGQTNTQCNYKAHSHCGRSLGIKYMKADLVHFPTNREKKKKGHTKGGTHGANLQDKKKVIQSIDVLYRVCIFFPSSAMYLQIIGSKGISTSKVGSTSI